MIFLLDTHSFLWAAFAPKNLSRRATTIINDPDSELLLSIASLWEIGILQSLGRLKLKVSIAEAARLAHSELGVALLPIEPPHIDRVRVLPFHHRDPFDRLLIAQALTTQTSVIGKDERFDAYGVQRVW